MKNLHYFLTLFFCTFYFGLAWGHTSADMSSRKQTKYCINLATANVPTDPLQAMTKVPAHLPSGEIRKVPKYLLPESNFNVLETNNLPEKGEKILVRFFEDKTTTLHVEQSRAETINGKRIVTILATSDNETLNTAVLVYCNGKIRVETADIARQRHYLLAYNYIDNNYQSIETDIRLQDLKCGVCSQNHSVPTPDCETEEVYSFFDLATRNTNNAIAETQTIDYLIVFDKTGEKYANSQGGIEVFSASIIASMNNVLQNSDIDARFRLADIMVVDYTSPGMVEGLTYAMNSEEIRNKRIGVKADLTAFCSEPAGNAATSGIAVQESKRDAAYSSIRASGAITSYTAVHEAAHNLGCQHSRDQFGAQGNHPYAVGANRTPYFTVMSYGTEDCGIRVPLFSGPNSVWKGVTMGSATEDNTRKFREVMPYASVFGDYLENKYYVEPQEWKPDNKAQNTEVKLFSNTYFDISSNVSWLTVSPKTGYRDITIKLGVTENPTGELRTGVVTIKGNPNYPTSTLTVMQSDGETNINNILQQNTTVICKNGTIKIETPAGTEAVVTDILGKIIFSDKLHQGIATIEVAGKNGVFIVHLLYQHKTAVYKIVNRRGE